MITQDNKYTIYFTATQPDITNVLGDCIHHDAGDAQVEANWWNEMSVKTWRVYRAIITNIEEVKF